MILTELRRLLQGRGPLSLGEIAGRLEASPEAVRAMLEVWIEKGRVQRLETADGCGSSCRRCDSSQTEYYVWQDPGGAADRAPACPVHFPIR